MNRKVTLTSQYIQSYDCHYCVIREFHNLPFVKLNCTKINTKTISSWMNILICHVFVVRHEQSVKLWLELILYICQIWFHLQLCCVVIYRGCIEVFNAWYLALRYWARSSKYHSNFVPYLKKSAPHAYTHTQHIPAHAHMFVSTVN